MNVSGTVCVDEGFDGKERVQHLYCVPGLVQVFLELDPIYKLYIGSHDISSKNYAQLHIFDSGMR